MQTYKVTGHKVILGVGITLKLTKSQASTRNHALKQNKNGIYSVLEPVEFKQGEIITIISGNISKAVLANLEEPSKEVKKQDQTTKPSTKNNKKSDINLSASKDNNKNNKDDNDKKDDKDKDPNPNSEKDSEEDKIINNGDVNSLPVTTK